MQTNLVTQIFVQGLIIISVVGIVLLILILVFLYMIYLEMRKTRELLEKVG